MRTCLSQKIYQKCHLLPPVSILFLHTTYSMVLKPVFRLKKSIISLGSQGQVPQQPLPAFTIAQGQAPQQQLPSLASINPQGQAPQQPVPAIVSDAAQGQVPRQQLPALTKNPTLIATGGTIPFTMTNSQVLGHSSTKSGTIPFTMLNSQALGHSSNQPAAQSPSIVPTPAPVASMAPFNPPKKRSNLSSMVNFTDKTLAEPTNAPAPQTVMMPSPGNPASTGAGAPQAVITQPPTNSDPPLPTFDLVGALANNEHTVEERSDTATPTFPASTAGLSKVFRNQEHTVEKPSNIPMTNFAQSQDAIVVNPNAPVTQAQSSYNAAPTLAPLQNAAIVPTTPSVARFQPSYSVATTFPPSQNAFALGTNPPVAHAQLISTVAPLNIQASRAVQQLARGLFDPYIIEVQLQEWWKTNPAALETLVGLYFQHSGRHPAEVGGQWQISLSGRGWRLSSRRLDVMEKNPGVPPGDWLPTPNDAQFQGVANLVMQGCQESLEGAIRWWSTQYEPKHHGVERVLRKAGWVNDFDLMMIPDYNVMHNILNMDDISEKTALIARAKAESPRYYD